MLEGSLVPWRMSYGSRRTVFMIIHAINCSTIKQQTNKSAVFCPFYLLIYFTFVCIKHNTWDKFKSAKLAEISGREEHTVPLLSITVTLTNPGVSVRWCMRNRLNCGFL